MPIMTDTDEAAAILRRGGLVALPTETVYGLGGAARDPLAVRQIYATKGRPAGHPVIIHLHASDDLSAYGQLDDRACALASAFWPGPMTLIVPRTAAVPDEVTGGLDTVGLRVPSHPIMQAVLAQVEGGIAAPSANRFGRVSPTTAQHVVDEFGPDLPVLDGGPCAVGIESTIIDLSSPKPAILRPGHILESEVAEVVGPLSASSTLAPGTLAQHYQPMTSLLLSVTPEADHDRLVAEGHRVAVLKATDAVSHARSLYAELRRLDSLGFDFLIAEAAPNSGLGEAINDRLRRAASKLSIDT